MKLTIHSFGNGDPIPSDFAFCTPDAEEHVAMAPNRNPHLSWDDVPEGTRSFALICHDPDAPADAADANQEGKTISKNVPRVNFYHWVLVNMPADLREISAGAVADGITPKGKDVGETEFGVTGRNDYTDWFEGDEDMAGTYGGYDGPCPPWNDERLHHYIFTLYALDVDKLDLAGDFGGTEAVTEIKEHMLASSEWMGTYTLNPDVG